MIEPTSADIRIEELLKVTIGLDGSTVGASLIHRAATRRMRSRGIADLDGYADLIARDTRELQELVEEVVVGETYFFREREALFALAALVQRQILVPRGNEPLRVLSAPCSSGEEPYSIAITLLAAGLSPERIAIDGVDVSQRAVELARRAAYRPNSFRGDTQPWAHYFVETPAGLEPVDRVRAVVRIEEANLLSPSFRAPHDQYDAIFCRNLLIYFDLEAQQRLIAALVRYLAPDGVLFVGAADTFAVRRAGFIALGRDLSFAYRLSPPVGHSAAASGNEALPFPRRVSGSTASDPATRRFPTRGRVQTIPRRPAADLHLARPPRRAAGQTVPGIPTPVAPVVSSIAEIARLANAGQLEAAAQLGDAQVAGDERSPALFALLGTIAAALGDASTAERHYRRALYLDPGHEEALLHLATLLDSRGDRAGGDRMRARARRRTSSPPELSDR